MIYRQTIQNLPETVLSNGGVGPVLPQITQLMSELKKARGNGAMPRFIDLPGKQDDLQQIYDIARRIRDNAEDVVILGTGGSSLGRKHWSP